MVTLRLQAKKSGSVLQPVKRSDQFSVYWFLFCCFQQVMPHNQHHHHHHETHTRVLLMALWGKFYERIVHKL